jgi:hypothetical protein
MQRSECCGQGRKAIRIHPRLDEGSRYPFQNCDQSDFVLAALGIGRWVDPKGHLAA